MPAGPELAGAAPLRCCCPTAAAAALPQGPEQRAAIGIKDNLVRFSCGVEAAEDIWAGGWEAP